MSTMRDGAQYWFPAKRYGWGWGFPDQWRGWAALAVFALFLVAGVFLFPPGKELGRFLVYVSVLCLGLFILGWLKGEPLRWRWGDD